MLYFYLVCCLLYGLAAWWLRRWRRRLIEPDSELQAATGPLRAIVLKGVPIVVFILWFQALGAGFIFTIELARLLLP